MTYFFCHEFLKPFFVRGIFSHTTAQAFLSLSPDHHPDYDWHKENRRNGADAEFCGRKDGAGDSVAEKRHERAAEKARWNHDERLFSSKGTFHEMRNRDSDK